MGVAWSSPRGCGRRSFEAHPRIDEDVDNVGKKIDGDVGDGDEKNAALEKRIIAGLDGLNSEAADARPGEDGFGDDGTGEKSAELKAENGDDRNERVAKGVTEQNSGFGKSLGAGGADIIGRQLFDDRTAHHARQDGGKSGTEGDGREDEVREAPAARDREPSENHGENQN